MLRNLSVIIALVCCKKRECHFACFFLFLLLDSGASAESVPLAITPSYMKYPVFPYSNPAEPQPDTRYLSSSTASTTLTAARLGPTDPDGREVHVLTVHSIRLLDKKRK